MKFDLERAFEAIAHSDLISFDVFDTALLRKVDQPTDIFHAMAFEASRITGDTALSFFRNRVEAEASAKSLARPSHRHITLENIYAEFRSGKGLTEQQRRDLQDMEMATEKKFTYANPVTLRLHDHALGLNKRVVFISDMYLPSRFIISLLEAHGYTSPEVFVSSEWGGNKASGKLYKIVRQQVQVPARRCLHFGDNFFADVIRARLDGWHALHMRRVEPEPLRAGENSVSRSITLGLTRKNSAFRRGEDDTNSTSEFWSAFGYEIAGPLYFNFIHWLFQQAHRDKVSRLLLCARDGYPLIHGVELLKEAWNVPLETTYFFASRRLIKLTTIGELNSEALDFMTMPNPGLTLRDFVLRLNLDPITHEASLLGLGFKSLDDRLTHDYFGRFLDPAYATWLRRWLQSNRDELLARTSEHAHLLQAYFEEVALYSPSTALVDIGWQATVARAVQDFARKHNPAFSLCGYFFGTSSDAERLVQAGGQVRSFFLHLGRPERRGRLVSPHEGLIELFFAAPHGSIIGLKKTPAGMAPIYGACEYLPEHLVFLETMREGAYRFMAEAARLMPDYLACPPSDDYVDQILRQVLLHPTRKQARCLGQMPYRVSYGESNEPRYFASLGQETAQTFSSQCQAYGRAAWKNGFLAQVSPLKGCLLRLALVLSGLYAAVVSRTLWTSLKWVLFKKQVVVSPA